MPYPSASIPSSPEKLFVGVPAGEWCDADVWIGSPNTAKVATLKLGLSPLTATNGPESNIVYPMLSVLNVSLHS